MCEWGNTVVLNLKIPADVASSGEEYIKPCAIDSCIAPLVKALNDAGITTLASCCGHGRVLGDIALADGRELMIVPDYITRNKVLEKMEMI